MRSSASSPIPGPSSSTVISISDRTRRQTMRTLPPAAEKDCALDSRLEITWPSRESWPGTENASAGPRPSKRTSTPTSCPSRVSLATVVSVFSSRRRSTGAMSCRCNSASRRLASEISEIRRSSRLTSCSITSRSRARLVSLRASGSVSTADRSEVSGFFSSWATSAANISIASIRLYSALVIKMTNALYSRIEAIEMFAADVAHELKNPLTSLRSAVETLPLARNETSRARLLEVIEHDVRRLDRLISDISDASRLDAELQRQDMASVDLRRLLMTLTSVANETRLGHDVPVEVRFEGRSPTDIFL